LDRDRDLGVSDLMSTFQDIGVSAGIMDRDRDRGLGWDQDGSGSLTSFQFFKTGSGSRGLGLLGDRLLIGLLGIACFLRDLLLRVLAGGRWGLRTHDLLSLSDFSLSLALSLCPLSLSLSLYTPLPLPIAHYLESSASTNYNTALPPHLSTSYLSIPLYLYLY
jgi:hypothetical protein